MGYVRHICPLYYVSEAGHILRCSVHSEISNVKYRTVQVICIRTSEADGILDTGWYESLTCESVYSCSVHTIHDTRFDRLGKWKRVRHISPPSPYPSTVLSFTYDRVYPLCAHNTIDLHAHHFSLYLLCGAPTCWGRALSTPFGEWGEEHHRHTHTHTHVYLYHDITGSASPFHDDNVGLLYRIHMYDSACVETKPNFPILYEPLHYIISYIIWA